MTRPTTILPDGSPLYPAEWSPRPLGDGLPPKPAAPRFPSDGHGRPKVGTSKTETTARVQGREAPRRRSGGDVGAILAPGGMLGLGSDQAPPIRGSESAKLPAIQPSQPTGKPANALESFVYAPPPGGHTKAYIENSPPPPPENPDEPLPIDMLDRLFQEAGWDESELVVERKLLYRRLETQARLMRRQWHHMQHCLRYPQIDENGAPMPVEVVRTKDGRLHRRGNKRCNCMGCVYCRLIHALAARKKALKFIQGWAKRGSWAVMVACTFSHPDPNELYISLNRAFRRALTAMRHGKPWERFCSDWGLGEWMYSMEDMINASYGFHPHQHPMYEIVASYLAKHPELQTQEGRTAWIKAFQAAHYKLWESALQKGNRHASPTFGAVATLSRLTDREVIAGVNYITKAAAELTGSATKDGKNGSRNMYALLDDAADESLPDGQRDLAESKFIEWQDGIRRKTRYFFSESSAKETGVGESEVPELEEEPAEVVMTITPSQDRALWARGDGWPNFLTMIERCGVEVASAWLERFSAPPHRRLVFGEEAA